MIHGTLIVIPLVAILSGCGDLPASVAHEVATHVAVGAIDYYSLAEDDNDRINYYEPIVLKSNEDRIQIKYLTVNDHAMHQEVVHLIKDHCGGSYIETSGQGIEGWTTVDAKCTHNSD